MRQVYSVCSEIRPDFSELIKYSLGISFRWSMININIFLYQPFTYLTFYFFSSFFAFLSLSSGVS